MKLILLAALVVSGLAQPLVAGDEWYLTHAPTRQTLRDVGMASDHVAYIVGDSATILRTADGGLTWAEADVDSAHLLTNVNLRATAVLPSGPVLIVGEQGRIVRGTDGHLQAAVLDPRWSLNDVTYLTDAVVVAVGKDESGSTLVLRSVDSGKTFTRMSTPEHRAVLVHVQFFNPSLGLALGSRPTTGALGEGVILRTEDGGRTWDTVLSVNGFYFTAATLTRGDLICSGITDLGNGAFYRSEHAGLQWRREEQHDIPFVTDMISYADGHVLSVGYRFIEVEKHLISIPSSFKSTDGGENWGISDFGENLQGIFRVSACVEKAIMTGDSGRVWLRWLSATRPTVDMVPSMRHLEFGSTTMATSRDSTVVDLVQNTGTVPHRIVKGLVFDPLHEFSLTESVDGRVIEPGAAVFIGVRFSPREVSMHWGFLVLQFDNGQEIIVHLSGTESVNAPRAQVVATQHVVDVGEVNDPFGATVNVGELLRNVGDSNVQVTGVAFEEGDASAFTLMNAEIPAIIRPGGTFPLELFFQPRSPGIYRLTLLVSVADTQLRIPVVGYSRMHAYNEIVDLGDLRIGNAALQLVEFSSASWRDWFNVVTLNEPGEPFFVDHLEPGKDGSVVASITVTPEHTGLVVAPLFASWSFADQRVSWIQRKVIRVNVIDAQTGVDNDTPTGTMHLSPQPVSSHLRIIHPTITTTATIDVLDVQGQRVLSHTVEASADGIHTSVDCSAIPSGAYLLVVRHGNASISKTIIKQ